MTTTTAPHSFGSLGSVRATIPSLATEAASELDDILNKRAVESPSSKKLGELLLAALQSNSGKRNSSASARSGTVAVFCHALHESPYEVQVDNMSDFIAVVTKISRQLEAASASKSEVNTLKQFCVALAKAAALYRPSAYTRNRRFPRR